MTGTVLEEGLRGAGGYLLERRPASASWQATTSAASARRATSSSRAIYREMRAGRTTPNGGVYIPMRHLGPDNVRQQFKGMVERCADCGFDLAGGLVEVVPTAHYMMGGVVFAPDCTHRAAGPVRRRRGHRRRARRQPPRRQRRGQLDRLRRHRRRRDGGLGGGAGALRASPTRRRSRAAVARARGAVRAQAPATWRRCARRCYDCMWDDVGILRTAEGLRARPRARSTSWTRELARTGVADGDRAFNLDLARLAQPEEPDGREPRHRARRRWRARIRAARTTARIFPSEPASSIPRTTPSCGQRGDELEPHAASRCASRA